MSSDLLLGVVLTTLAYAGLIATVVHARAVIRRLAEDDFEGRLPGYGNGDPDE
ncbi:MAG: hypothetical protein GWN82_11810 [Gemmatimonadetes bacterium]|nr:hypothetical protein [Gemmatimonadota bacterium]NIV61728.1 hypothetical protein [Gemmatimonadota bacterium]